MLISKGSDIYTKAGKVYFLLGCVGVQKSSDWSLTPPLYLSTCLLAWVALLERIAGSEWDNPRRHALVPSVTIEAQFLFRGQAHAHREQVHLMMQLVPFAEESGALLRCSLLGETASGRPFTCAKAGAMHVRRLKLTHFIFYYPLSTFSHSIMPICTSESKHSNHSDQSVVMTSNSDLFSLFFSFPLGEFVSRDR